jgi:uncharacterized protein
MKIKTKFPFEQNEDPDMGIVLADGCRLSARVWRPIGAGPVPAILEFLPYRKRDGTHVRDALTHPYLAGHGYACIRVDMRGNGDSQGLMEDEYTPQELSDACEVIAWLAEQDWCSGSVGMMGISWGGFNGLQVAALQPPALKAVISLCSTVDRFADDIHFKGGCLLGENFGWAAQMFSYSSRPPDPLIFGDGWRDEWLMRLEATPFLAKRWLNEQSRGDYWKHGSICEDFSAVQVPVLAIGGWHDGYRNTVAKLLEAMPGQVKGIMGPWIHKYPHFAGPKPAIGFLQEALRWWDKWLKGIDTGVQDDPAYRAYVMESVAPKPWLEQRPGRWVAEAEWPSVQVSPMLLNLRGDRTLGSADLFDLAVSSAQNCGAKAGEFFPFAFGPELPDDQQTDDLLSLCFDGPAFEADIDLLGAPFVDLWVASDKPMAQIAVRLCDLRPDGSSALIAHGFLNLSHRNGSEFPVPMTPGDVEKVRVALDQCAYRLPKGHRLRLAISTTYWPFVWPSAEAATIIVSEGALSLLVRALHDEAEWVFAEPESATPWKHEILTSGGMTRKESRESDGRCVIRINNDHGQTRDLEHGLIAQEASHEVWSISPDDPLSALCEIEWNQEASRGKWSYKTLAKMTMTCDAGSFFLQGELTAWEGEKRVFNQVWHEQIERKFV